VTNLRPMEISRPFVRLPYLFDAEKLTQEVAVLPEGAWMDHPSKMRGNSAVPLISRGGGDNDDFDGAMRVTPHLECCPYLQQVMASFGEVLGRSRLMRLAPGCEVSTHVDFNYHWYSRVRIHVPVITEPGVIFHCGDAQIHMQTGECWIFNSWRRHRVTHGGQHDRIHLVIDTAGSSRFWRTVERMTSLAAGDVHRPPEQHLEHVAFVPGRKVNIETERYNTAPVMAPGEVEALVKELVRDFGDNPVNDAGLVSRYKDMLGDFARDWRMTWLRYGYEQRGWPEYQRVIDTLQKQLHPEPRALVTGSNGVGVNPIIVQRILRPALAGERLQEFIDGASSHRAHSG